MIEKVMLLIHLVITIAIALRVLMSIKEVHRKNIWMKVVAATIFMASASTAIRIFTGQYTVTEPGELILISLFCLMLYRSDGYLTKLFERKNGH
ncbi:phage holin family protein [Enterobacter sp. Bisph1]|uniref:phage holin family protein n=1 Tax=Enterobacter sp. Bisph1 TaxID=1274399 RepID=UPI00057BD7C1|nr:phage holin family protein [Enterobacter sp. Bisph1]